MSTPYQFQQPACIFANTVMRVIANVPVNVSAITIVLIRAMSCATVFANNVSVYVCLTRLTWLLSVCARSADCRPSTTNTSALQYPNTMSFAL